MAAEIHKLQKNGVTIYPATTTDAVVDFGRKKSLSSIINNNIFVDKGNTDYGIRSISTNFDFNSAVFISYYNRDKSGTSTSSQYIKINFDDIVMEYNIVGGTEKKGEESITLTNKNNDKYKVVVYIDWKPFQTDINKQLIKDFIDIKELPYDEFGNSTTNSVTQRKITEKFNDSDKNIESLEKTILGGDYISDININLTSGGYYIKNTIDIQSGGGQYSEKIDISKFVGGIITIVLKYSKSGSGRATLITDNDDSIIYFCLESDYNTEAEEGFKKDILVPNNAKYLRFSCDSSNSILSSKVSIKYKSLIDEVNKNTTNIEQNKDRILALEKASSSIKEIQPYDFPELPYKISKTSFGYEIEDIYTYKTKEYKKIYVDSISGLDTNDGSSSSLAVKTMKKAFSLYVSSNLASEIIVVNKNAEFYYNDLYGELLVKKDIAINGNGAKFICGNRVSFIDFEGIKKATLDSSFKLCGCLVLDDTNIDSYGMYKPLTILKDIESVKSTSNSFFVDGNDLYVNLDDYKVIDNVIAISSNYRLRFNNNLAEGNVSTLIKNINSIGPTYGTGKINLDSLSSELIILDSIFQHNIVGDCVSDNDYNISYKYNVLSGYSKADIFNVHASYLSEEKRNNTVHVEVNCLAIEAGIYGDN